jgi:hypothetical protein
VAVHPVSRAAGEAREHPRILTSVSRASVDGVRTTPTARLAEVSEKLPVSASGLPCGAAEIIGGSNSSRPRRSGPALAIVCPNALAVGAGAGDGHAQQGLALTPAALCLALGSLRPMADIGSRQQLEAGRRRSAWVRWRQFSGAVIANSPVMTVTAQLHRRLDDLPGSAKGQMN